MTFPDSTTAAQLLVTVGAAKSPHMNVWLQEASEAGWERRHVESHPALSTRGLFNSFKNLRSVRANIRLVRLRGGHVIVQAHGAGRPGLIACTLVTAHPTIIVHGSEVILADERHSLNRALVRWVLRRSTEIIVTAESTEPHVRRLASPAMPKVRLVHPGVEWTQFRRAHTDLAGAVSFLSVRRLTPHYRILELIDAFARTKDGAIGDCALRLLQGGVSTDDSYARAVVEHIGRHPSFTFIRGFLSLCQLIDTYGETDVAVSLAINDQLSASVLESLAAGCVLLVSDLPAYRAIRDLPQVQFVAPNASVDDLARAIVRTHTVLRELGRSGKARSERADAARTAFESAFQETAALPPM